MNNHPKLFDLPPDSTPLKLRIEAFKKQHGILTHRPDLNRADLPWLALIPFPDEKHTDLFDIIAHSSRLYEESGWLALDIGELSAIRQLCEQRNIPCPL